MFCDEVKVEFIAGKGGNGAIAFRREKFVPRGGPSGGDGGVGGSIILKADRNINTLSEFNTYKIFRADAGENGKGSNMGGSDAKNLILPVPVGTIIFDENKKQLIADLANDGQTFIITRGGRGGYGNAHFKSSTRQAPRFAELGEPGQHVKRLLELKLVADVGIVGLPSVGKSTLLSRISNARPKIAAYHFTTLIPNLGLVSMKPFGGSIHQSFVACDLPGLIEGAHAGKGLGIEFLKHVARNRVLVHLLDATSQSVEEDYKTVRKELRLFDKTLLKKPTLIAFNKIDALSEEFFKKQVRAFKKKHRTIKTIFTFSAVSGQGLKELMHGIYGILQIALGGTRCRREPSEGWVSRVPSHSAGELKNKERIINEQEKSEFKVFKPAETFNPKSIQVKRIRGEKGKRIFQVSGPRLEQIAVMTDFSNPEAVARVYDVLERLGAVRHMARLGARLGDEVRIGQQTLVFRW